MKKRINYFVNKYFNIYIIIVLFILLSIPYFDLPGIYMDAANPDYVGLHILHPNIIPAWIFSDNIIATLFGKMWNYPILNSLYGTNFPAYIYIFFVKLFDSSLFTFRLMHLCFSILELIVVYKLIINITKNKNISSLLTLFLAVEPSFIFSQRTQYYLQLFPLIFFLWGLSLVISDYKEKKHNKIIFLSSTLFGLAACSYFIFAGYYFAFLLSCLLYFHIKKNNIKKYLLSVLGFIVGYLPYIYAHISLLIQNKLSGYIELLKGLETYGISDGRVGFFDKILYVINRFSTLSGGSFIINLITKKNIKFSSIQYLFFIIFVVAFIYTVIILFNYYKVKNRKENKIYFILTILLMCFIIHFILGVIIGKSLMYQHYIMLLPLMYIFIFVCFYHLIITKKLKRISYVVIFMSFFAIINLTNIVQGYQKINYTKGVDYYSQTINNLGYYLNSNISSKDLIICPQWGYSMGISIITAGRTEIWNQILEEDIINKLDNNNNYDTIYLIDDNKTNDDMINRIVSATKKEIVNIITFDNKESNTLDIRLLILR